MADWFLRVTKRCLVEDLGLAPEAIGSTLSDLAVTNDILQAFLDKRSNHPDGQEVVTGLRTNKVIFTFHVGENRGATWFHKAVLNASGVAITPPVVWLLAVRFHRSGKAEDAYPFFRDLDAKNRLLPTAEDVRAAGPDPTYPGCEPNQGRSPLDKGRQGVTWANYFGSTWRSRFCASSL